MTRLLLLMMTLALQGCAGTLHAGSEAILPMEKLDARGDCGGVDRPEVVWITNADTWQERSAQLVRQQMQPAPLPAVDFSREAVLLIAMGQQATGGYGLYPAGRSATVQGGVLTVPVTWHEPPPGAILTQAMTSPCLVVKLPKGTFRQIQIVDQDGRLRLEGGR